MLLLRALLPNHAYRRLRHVRRVAHVLNLIALIDGVLIALHLVRVELMYEVITPMCRNVKEMNDALW